MKTRLLRTVLFLLIPVIMMSSTAMAGDKEKAGLTIWVAKSSGTWESGNSNGYFRATVRRKIAGHGTDSVSVDILELLENGSTKVVRTIPLNSPNYKGYIVDISFNPIDKKRIAVSLDIEMKGMYGIKIRDIFIVSMDGNVQSVASAEFSDI